MSNDFLFSDYRPLMRRILKDRLLFVRNGYKDYSFGMKITTVRAYRIHILCGRMEYILAWRRK